jgi:hypothetical protein
MACLTKSRTILQKPRHPCLQVLQNGGEHQRMKSTQLLGSTNTSAKYVAAQATLGTGLA